MITLKNLGKSFGKNVIFEGINYQVNKGDAVVIIGPSGCGKSTLLRCMNGLEKPTTGEVWFEGKNIAEPRANIDQIRSRMGMVYQSFNLFSHRNVLENVITAPMIVNRVSRSAAIAEGMNNLRLVGMENRAFHMPSQLSGGQKQRVAIARCLAMHPDVILFDEPTSALDPTMVDEVLSVIQRLVREKMTCVIVTHEMSFAQKIASQVIYLDERGIYESGSAEQIFVNPQREKTQAFIHKLRVFERTITAANADLYSFMTEVRSYCSQYGFSNRQLNTVNLIYEELLHPNLAAGAARELNFKLRCNTAGEKIEVIVTNANAASDLLSAPGVDELGVRMIQGMAREMESRLDEGRAELRVLL